MRSRAPLLVSLALMAFSGACGPALIWYGRSPDRRHRVQAFEADLGAYAGQHVLVEFACEGEVRGSGQADWYNPQILVGD